MKHKIIGICLCLLLLAMIPIAAGLTTKNTDTGKIGWTTLQGITLTQPRQVNGGALISFRCLFVHYVGQGLGQRTTGIRYGGQEMVIPANFNGILMNHIIVGWCIGVLEF
ncbi:MAG TPA: hypothetical protein VN365_07490 [Candidatus Thermoplasmatota archaeon]|jgi:hypothetical protein|nr:hypothetical protein [Candidatus Thermoplasmatota archaeon]